MRVLLVEDEPRLGEQLAAQLKAQQFAADLAPNGAEALYLAGEWSYDLAIVDLGLPDISGMELIRRLRQQNQRYPILILTARGDWQDKVEGLEAGADDYLTKPFHAQELLARLNALLRRAAGHASPQLQFGPILLDSAAKQVRLDGAPVELTAYEYATLEYLVLKAGQVISKTELTEHLYDQDFDRDSNVIEVFITRLRKKLDPEGRLKPIATERGRGYRFVLRATTDPTDPGP